MYLYNMIRYYIIIEHDAHKTSLCVDFDLYIIILYTMCTVFYLSLGRCRHIV